MEPRQPNEANQSPPASPKAESATDANLSNTPSPQPEKRSGNQSRNNRQDVPYRDNNNRVAPAPDDSNGADQPARSFKPVPNQRNNRQQPGRNDEQRQKGQRENRPEKGNRQDRENRPEKENRQDQENRQEKENRQDRENRPENKGQKPQENRQRGEGRPDRDRGNRNQPRESLAGDPDTRDFGNQPPAATEYAGREDRLIIGISLGDYNGIGPEVILKALQYNRLQKICTPVIYGSMRILNRYRNLLNLKDWNLNGAQTIGQISHKLTNVITCWPDQNQDIQPGQVTPEAGQAALACLQRAVDDLKDGKIDALVTAPINKYNIQSEEFNFPGHTEYLAQQFGVQDNLMFLVSETLRVGVVTGHVPLGSVRQEITPERISQKLKLMMHSLKQDFGIDKPKIAVLGLNPHAGEEGLLGNEEKDIIKPLLTQLLEKGELTFGPYPADGFFGTRAYRKFDAVLAMYHDQGLIPFKAIAFEEGVNFTAGMPAVRTSPDHGTAYDIAGKNLADETSMLQAIYTAIDVARNRKEYLELEAGKLK
ncbi:4-hydroxythreonine-4-phosphate dehydrogenase PdxA [Spirosoma spitsbergense]|uniref:4-hydroxythreonine-4-phosphate dehydrogenase PdxA n=1 Tax=Spirosoma spitsbergense TaxID=431554 RepID=UPI0003788B03|nr:4-hydroxythreonine-4-phosphate dehydrogenase PdxA [Spirosoma spitsbergense]